MNVDMVITGVLVVLIAGLVGAAIAYMTLQDHAVRELEGATMTGPCPECGHIVELQVEVG